MHRKAERGYVTGGRVFGYDNVRTASGHVEREVNAGEAAVVHRIFDLCVKGLARSALIAGAESPTLARAEGVA